ncbi:MAG TPA: segregation/condensation protein A [Thermoanaerobaculia bacterium]|nr:segregation/condensation protein A [Thermoanaerobaculia bacterium]
MNTPVPSRGLLPESWRVHLPVFDGPLDLLLQLVKVNKVEITDIPVATVCDQFHEYLALMEELNLDVAAEYIYEAALLIHLKSRLLLPRTPRHVEDGESDPRQELVDRLLEYRRIKDAAQTLAEIDSVRRGVWTRDVEPPRLDPEEGETIDLGDLSMFDLLGALRQVLVRFEKHHPPAYHLELETFSVREQVRRLLAAMDRGRPYDLIDDLRERSCRAEVVAAFLAVLELARLNLVRLHQTDGGDVVLYRTTREATTDHLEAISG